MISLNFSRKLYSLESFSRIFKDLPENSEENHYFFSNMYYSFKWKKFNNKIVRNSLLKILIFFWRSGSWLNLNIINFIEFAIYSKQCVKMKIFTDKYEFSKNFNIIFEYYIVSVQIFINLLKDLGHSSSPILSRKWKKLCSVPVS